MRDSDNLFYEEQGFPKFIEWLYWGAQIPGLVLIYTLAGMTIVEYWWFYLIFLTVLTLGGLLMRYFKLITRVGEDGLHYRFRPLGWRHIPVSKISKAANRNYSALREYGGWGYRISFKHGRAWIMGGNQGLQLEIVGESPLLIGSRRGEELAKAMEKAMNAARS